MTFRRFACGLGCALVLSGCATSVMKSTPFYTGPQRAYNVPVEKRVNLWPLSYYRDPALSVMWPLCGFDLDADSGWLLTAQWSKESTSFYPFFHFSSDDSAVFPLFYRDANSLFSLPWCSWQGSRDGWAVPPLLTWGQQGPGRSDYRLRSLLGLFGVDKKGGNTSSWCFPLYYADDSGDFYTPLFGWSARNDVSWAFPLWCSDKGRFFSLPWCSRAGRDGTLDSWTIPPLLTYGQRKHDVFTTKILLGIAGWDTKEGECTSSWCFPFYYADDGGDVYTPLFGRSAKRDFWIVPPLLTYGQRKRNVFSTNVLLGLAGWDEMHDSCMKSWCFPFFTYEKKHLFDSPVYVERDDWWAIPPLLTWGEKDVHGNRTLHPLVFGEISMTTNGYHHSALVPFYYHDADTLYLFPYLSSKGVNCLFPLWYRGPNSLVLAGGLLGMSNNTQWFTPAVIHEGKKWLLGFGLAGWSGVHDVEYSWLLPLYWANHGSGDFVSLPFGSIGKFSWWLTPLFGATDKMWWATPFVGQYGNGKRTFSWLFPFASWGESVSTEWSQALFGLLWNSETNRKTGHVDKSILWRLWHYEEKNGNVSMDMFPFVTYDRKANGYEKTSFLWKFYNHETDSRGRSHLDLFFIPVK